MPINLSLDLNTKEAKKKATSFFRAIEGFARASQSVTRAQPFGGRLAPGIGGAIASVTGVLQAASPLVNQSIEGFFGAAQRFGARQSAGLFPNATNFLTGLTASNRTATALVPFATAALMANPQAKNGEILAAIEPIRQAIHPISKIQQQAETILAPAAASKGDSEQIERLIQSNNKLSAAFSSFSSSMGSAFRNAAENLQKKGR